MNSLDLSTTDSAALRQALLTDRTGTLTRLYARTFPMVRRYVLRHGGSPPDAQDVFHDALVTFYEKAVSDKLVLTAAPSTYLMGICRHLWLRELRRRGQRPHTALQDEHAEELADAPETVPTAALSVLDYVEQLGDKCRSILLSFYYFQQPLEQIARTHQYGSVRSATVQKFKCLERLRRAVRPALAALHEML